MSTVLDNEKMTFEVTNSAKKKVITYIVVGIVLLIIGIIGLSSGWGLFDPASAHHGDGHAMLTDSPEGYFVAEVDHSNEHVSAIEDEAQHLTHGHDAEHHDVSHDASEAHSEGHGEHHGYSYWKRIKAALWHNNIYFLGASLIAVFFMCALRTVWSGWAATFNRVMEAFGYYLPVAAIITIIGFFIVKHDVFHWTHDYLYDSDNSSTYDKIIDGKGGYFFWPLAKGSFPLFFVIRMLLFFGAWVYFWYAIRKWSVKEDLEGGTTPYYKMMVLATAFLGVFAVSSSMSAWDWVMSIDTHWFSTMFGWYVFASWLVTGISAIAYAVVKLKEAGYLKLVNAEHLHDLGKLMFAFSIFWTYIWFSQFILYWYANIPEEIVWFVDRLMNNMGNYAPIFVINLLINFFFPFLFLMTRNAKRQTVLIKVAASALLIGHWFDFYLMIYPGVIKEHGGLNLGNLFIELGMFLIFLGIFVFTVLKGLSKAPMIAKNHPMLAESIHHHT